MKDNYKVKISSDRGVLAGLFIGIGGIAYLSTAVKPLGAFLFAVGLLTVILQKYSLFTGKIGYVSDKSEAVPLALMLLRNLFGAALAGFAARAFSGGALSLAAEKLCDAKLRKPLPEVFIASVFCGIMIYAAVELFAKNHHPLLVIMPIMTFILCGFEHCIANAFYFAAAFCFRARTAAFLLVCIAGNAVGSIAVRLFERFRI